ELGAHFLALVVSISVSTRVEVFMPIVQIDVTAGSASVEAKTELVAKITKAVDEAYPLPVQSSKRQELGGRGPDTRIYIREHAREKRRIRRPTSDRTRGHPARSPC